VEAKYMRRIITSWWFRFRRAIESTPTVLIVVTPVSCIRSCATLVLEMKNEGAIWPNSAPFVLENNDAPCTTRKGREASMPGLSLVTESIPQPDSYSLPPTYTHLLQGIRAQVNQERPTSWIGGPARFKTSLH